MSKRELAALSEYDSEIVREAKFKSVLSRIGARAAASVGRYPGRHTRQRSRDRTAVDLAKKHARHLKERSSLSHGTSMASISEEGSMLTLETGPPVRAPTLAALRSMARQTLVDGSSGDSGHVSAGLAADSVTAGAAAVKQQQLSNPTLVRGRIGDENEASLLVAGRVPAASSTPDGWWSRVQLEMDRRQGAAQLARKMQ